MQPTLIYETKRIGTCMNLQWYVLRSRPNKEMILWREIIARGLESFYPQLHVHPVNPRSRKVLPYFPGYLFVCTDLEQVGTGRFQWMPFSSGLLCFDGIPATVPHNLIEAIRRHVAAINTAGGAEIAGLKHGETVIIRGGPFEGYQAIFDTRLPGRERVRVLLRLLQMRDVNVELPLSQVERKKKD